MAEIPHITPPGRQAPETVTFGTASRRHKHDINRRIRGDTSMATLSKRAEPNGEAPSGHALPLAEAHHRIANNLEVIGSLLRLQAGTLARESRQLTTQDVRQILEEAAGRIATVSLLHRLLSGAPEQEVIDLGPYLRKVCENLAAALAFGGSLDLSGLQDACRVRADHAAHVAVLVGEFVTNAIKYGSPSGRIGVSCHEARDGSLVLEVGDDGAGLPDGFDPAVESGLGLRVARGLAQQLGATTQFDSTDHGLTVRVTIPRPTANRD